MVQEPVVREAPLLANGDVMSRAEFHERYSRCEGLERVELIEGVVYMPSPVSLEHSRPQKLVFAWLDAYVGNRTDVAYDGETSVLLDGQNEFVPDAILYRVSPERVTTTDQSSFITGAPELVVEIAASSRSRDLHHKKAAYERNGVLEYIVWRVQDAAMDFFALRDGAFMRRKPDAAGLIASEAFPGLTLNVPAMLALDRARVIGRPG